MAWRSSRRCRSRPPTFTIAAARRIAGISRRPSTSAAIRSCSTISISRPAATFPTPTRTPSSRTSSISTARWRGWFADAQARRRAPARACAASPWATSTWRRWSTTCGATSSSSRSSRTRRSRSTCSAGCRPRSTGSTCRAASCRPTRSSIRGGAIATTTGAPSNRGRRLDHILATPALSGAIRGHHIDADLRDWEKASDHVPVLATFEV